MACELYTLMLLYLHFLQCYYGKKHFPVGLFAVMRLLPRILIPVDLLDRPTVILQFLYCKTLVWSAAAPTCVQAPTWTLCLLQTETCTDSCQSCWFGYSTTIRYPRRLQSCLSLLSLGWGGLHPPHCRLPGLDFKRFNFIQIIVKHSHVTYTTILFTSVIPLK